MGARDKLNEAFATGSLLMAAFLGCVTGSWGVFIVAAVILLSLNLLGGDIRPGNRR